MGSGRHYNLLERIFRASSVLTIEQAWSDLRNNGPHSELSANFLDRCASVAAAFLARFWPFMVRVVAVLVWVGVRVRRRRRLRGWVGSTPARTLIPAERCNS